MSPLKKNNNLNGNMLKHTNCSKCCVCSLNVTNWNQCQALCQVVIMITGKKVTLWATTSHFLTFIFVKSLENYAELAVFLLLCIDQLWTC